MTVVSWVVLGPGVIAWFDRAIVLVELMETHLSRSVMSTDVHEDARKHALNLWRKTFGAGGPCPFVIVLDNQFSLVEASTDV